MPREEIGSDRSPNTTTSKSTRGGSEDSENKIGNAPFQVHSEFVNTLQDLTRDWMARATSEVELGLKLSKKLSVAHSVPDAIAAYQEWLSEEMAARSEDASRLMSNGQKFMDTSTRLLSNGWMSTGTTT
jgi:hypothetical protein